MLDFSSMCCRHPRNMPSWLPIFFRQFVLSNQKKKTNFRETGARHGDVEVHMNCVQESASIDVDLVKTHGSTETSKSHTLLSEEEGIPVACSSMACKDLRHAYLEFVRSCSIAPLFFNVNMMMNIVMAVLVVSRKNQQIKDTTKWIIRHRDICTRKRGLLRKRFSVSRI